MKTPRIRTIVRPAHSPKCGAVESVANGYWSNPWGPLDFDEPSFYGTIAGNRKQRNNVKWLVFMCNDPGCRARLLVRSDDLLDYLSAQERQK